MAIKERNTYGKKLAGELDDLIMRLNYDDDELLSQNSVDKLKHALNAEGTSTLSSYGKNAHADDHSGNRTDIDILDSVCSPDSSRKIDGQFASERAQWTMVAEVLHKNAKEIADFKDLEDFGKATNRCFPVQMANVLDDGCKSTGFMEVNGFYYKFETDSCATVVIKNDKTSNSAPFGVTVQSAYPGWSTIPDGIDVSDKKFQNVDNSINTNRMQRYGKPLTNTVNNLARYFDNADRTARSNIPINFFKSDYGMPSNTDDRRMLITRKDSMSPEMFAAYGVKSGAVTLLNESNADLIKKTDTYKRADKLEKARLLFKADPSNAYDDGKYDPDKAPNIRVSAIRYDTYSHEDTFTITKTLDPSNDKEIRCFVNESGLSIKKYENGKSASKTIHYPPSSREDTDYRAFVKSEPRFSKMVQQVYKNVINAKGPDRTISRGHEFNGMNLNTVREPMMSFG